MKISRKGVSTMIGGMIILAVLLTALTTMVFVSQQYDAYQQIVSSMSKQDIDRFSENLVANYPGLYAPASSTTCGTNTCYQYTMSLSNVGGLTNYNNNQANAPASGGSGEGGGGGGGVTVQIARIYINTTVPAGLPTTGCAPQNGNSPCILTPTSSATAYGFLKSQAVLNPGEFSHTVTFWLPSSIGMLPNPTPPTPENTVWIITTRGRVFTFQWPFPPTGQALEAVNAVVATGTMRVAYTGFDNSANEPTWSHNAPNGQYCHQELSNPSDEIAAGTYGTLYFVNPWITDTILGDVAFGSPPPTIMYIFAQFTNTKSQSVTITTGSLLIQVTAASANQKVYFIGGQYIGGIVTGGTFVEAPNALTVPADPSKTATLIFKIYNYNVGTQKNPTGAATLSFSGMAAVSNTAKDPSYYGASLLLEGFYDRTSCSTP